MAVTITNQALLQYTYGTTTAVAASNIATTVLNDTLTGEKTVLEADYRAGENLTYIITLTNSGTSALTDVAVTDDLGTYAVSPTLDATPLTYGGAVLLYINGVLGATITPTVDEDSVTFVIPSIPAGATAMLIYDANVNAAAPLTSGSAIVNTAAVSGAGITDSPELTARVEAEDYADVSVFKEMTPNPVTEGSLLTYTFTIENYGNTEATGLVLTDAFDPAPAGITVTVDGTVIPPSDYTYVDGTLTLPAAGSGYEITVPAATFTRNDATGEFTVTPGVRVITVTGTI